MLSSPETTLPSLHPHRGLGASWSGFWSVRAMAIAHTRGKAGVKPAWGNVNKVGQLSHHKLFAMLMST